MWITLKYIESRGVVGTSMVYEAWMSGMHGKSFHWSFLFIVNTKLSHDFDGKSHKCKYQVLCVFLCHAQNIFKKVL